MASNLYFILPPIIENLINYIKENKIPGTSIMVLLMSSKGSEEFYEKFGFDANEAQRLKMMCHVD